MSRFRLATCAALLLFAAPAPGQQQVDVMVIVHASNPVASLSKDEVSKIFLKRQARWPSGGAVAPVDLTVKSKVKDSFARRFHDRSASALESFWQQQIFSGQETPPPVRDAEAEVIDFVARNRNGIGYVTAGTKLPADVKILRIQ